MLNVVSILATCGRHTCLERSIRCFLDQDYEGPHTLLIYNNAKERLELSNIELPENKKILLINKNYSSETNEAYKNLGEIYRDILEFIPDDIEIVYHHDDDDIFLPNHISEGIKGIKEAFSRDQIAYKPMYSYYRSPEGMHIMRNNLEPSIFLTVKHLKKFRYSDATTEQHLQWLNPLVDKDLIYVKEHGIPTLIYNWGDGNKIPTYKTSGDCKNPNNFNLCREMSRDHGDGIITPISHKEAREYYKLVDNLVQAIS